MSNDTFNNPFEQLKGVKLKAKAKPAPAAEVKAPAKPAVKSGPKFGLKPSLKSGPQSGAKAGPKSGQQPSQEEASSPQDDGDLFTQAMSGVALMSGRETGRQVVGGPNPTAPPQAVDPEAEARAKLYDLVAGKVEFELEYTDEYVQGFVKGMDQKIFRQLKAGQLSPEGHLDLHGLNADQAYETLLGFVRERYFLGNRCLLLIPGRGINSPGGMPVLKQELKSWLTRDPLKRVVLAFATAQPRHGGAGAVYVLLRQRKKNEGRIRWENLWGDD